MRPAPHNNTAASLAGFTLLELCIAIFIGVMIILAAIPSVSGVIEDQRAKKLFNQFDDLARAASHHAITERRPYVLEWDDTGVFMRPLEPVNEDEAQGTQRVDFGDKLAPDLTLPASLEKHPPRIWTFWPSGTCEPAVVVCHVPASPWTATYNPLTEQAAFTSP
jgi:type II secretory pathway pseudopilin PulG